jgi:Tol biopolymer transport system component
MRAWMRASALAALGAAIGCHGVEAPATPVETFLSPPGANDLYPVFSPDGGHVAYWVPGSNGVVLTVARSDMTGAVSLDTSSVNGAAVWSPDGRQFAYEGGPNIDIWLDSVQGGARRQLTTAAGIEAPVQWDSAGKRLVMVATGAGGQISSSVLTVATRKTVPLYSGPGVAVPLWSPDGSRMAYTLVDGEKTTIWVADSVGGNARQLTHEGFEMLADHPWSPDGKELLYTSGRTGLPDVWVIPVNGDSARQLTRDVKSDTLPCWSPDGKWVAFLSDRGGQTDVWMVAAAGGTAVRVTNDAAVESNLQWVDHGTKVAFAVADVHNGLWTHSLNDSSEHRLTPDSIRVGDWDLSPDGRTLVVDKVNSGGTTDIVLVPVSGGSPRTLVANGASNSGVQWSPDGSKIAFVSNKTGNQDIWVVDTAGSAPTDLTGWPGQENSPGWSSDGKSVYFLADRDAHPFADLWKVAAAGGTPVRLTHAGTVAYEAVAPGTGEVLLGMLNGAQGQWDLERLTAAGSLERISGQASSILGYRGRPFSPRGDSIAVYAQGPHASLEALLLPTRGGAGRVVGGPNTLVTDWSRDGKTALCSIGSPHGDLCVLNVKTGTVRRLMQTPDDEAWSNLFLPGDTSIVFQRESDSFRIATVDVGELMTRGKQ